MILETHVADDPRSKAGEVFRILKEDILAGRLKPGEKLAFGKLRTRYPFGLAPLREALVRLSAEGLARGEEQRGFHVAPISQSELLDLTRVSIQLESEAVSNAISHATAQTDHALLSAFHQLNLLEPGGAEDRQAMDGAWSSRHTHFHECLVGGCDSPWLLKFRRSLFDQAERYRRISFSVSAETRDLGQEHRHLMVVVLDRDPARARQLIETHWQQTADVIIARLPVELWDQISS